MVLLDIIRERGFVMITEARKKALEGYVVTAIEGGAETINDVWSYIGTTPYWVETDEVEFVTELYDELFGEWCEAWMSEGYA